MVKMDKNKLKWRQSCTGPNSQNITEKWLEMAGSNLKWIKTNCKGLNN